MERMHASLESGARVIALLSNEYLASDHCAAEWLNVIAHDPLNKRARLIVMRVNECTPTGLLTALAYWDLVPIRADPALLRDVVLAAVKPGRHKGEATPGAPYWREARAVVHRDIKATPSFTGREADLAAIDAALRSGGAAAVTQPVVVHGLGGIGKSVLAREYAHRNQESYAGVWWLNAAKPDDADGFDGIETALVELHPCSSPASIRSENRPATARKALDFIAHGGFEKPWLLVYDNVDDPRALREWAPVGNAQVLATSRLGGWPKTVSAIEIETGPRPTPSVTSSTERPGRPDRRRRRDHRRPNLGCLPLALSHAAAYLRDCVTVTAADYVDALVEHMSEAPEDAEYPRAVFATFNQAISEAEAKAPGARAVLSLAAFYAPDAIPEELFQQPPQCYPPALAGVATDKKALAEAMGKLHNLSLIDFEPARRVFSVHRLAQAAARDALGVAAGTWAESALRAMYAAFPEPEPNTWPACERLVTHARAVAAHVTTDSRELGLRSGPRRDLPSGARRPWRRRATVRARARVLQRLAAADPGNAGWQRDLSVSHDKIGDVLVAQGNLAQALESYRASLAIAERLAGADPGNAGWQRDLSVSHNKIGDVLVAQGNLAQALESYRASLAIRERLAGADPGNAGWQRDLSVSHNKIGDVLVAQGNLAQALESYRASLAIAERLAGADPGNAGWQRDLSVSHNKIGDVLVAQGNLAQALESYRASLDIGSGWPGPIRETPGGNAICRCRTTRSATCSWPRAISPRRWRATGRPWTSPSGWPGPIRETPGGNAILIVSNVKLAEIGSRGPDRSTSPRQHYAEALRHRGNCWRSKADWPRRTAWMASKSWLDGSRSWANDGARFGSAPDREDGGDDAASPRRHREERSDAAVQRRACRERRLWIAALRSR